MKLEILIAGLSNPNPAVRRDVVCVLGMTEEVRTLDALRDHFQREADPGVKQAVAWAGKRLHQAQQAGYTTINEIFRHFGIDREIDNLPSAAEAEMMRKMDQQFSEDINAMRVRATRKQMGLSAAAGLGVGLIGGATMGLSAAMGGLAAGAGAASSNMNTERPQIGTSRTPPVAPTNSNIDIWVKRLRESKLPAQRSEAAIELAGLNNPSALPHLAAAFINDESQQVRDTAERFGKILYWSSVYWEMEQDGSLQAEIDRRIKERGKGSAPPDTDALPSGSADTPDGPTSGAGPSVDVGEILRKAQQARDERKRKR